METNNSKLEGYSNIGANIRALSAFSKNLSKQPSPSSLEISNANLNSFPINSSRQVPQQTRFNKNERSMKPEINYDRIQKQSSSSVAVVPFNSKKLKFGNDTEGVGTTTIDKAVENNAIVSDLSKQVRMLNGTATDLGLSIAKERDLQTKFRGQLQSSILQYTESMLPVNEIFDDLLSGRWDDIPDDIGLLISITTEKLDEYFHAEYQNFSSSLNDYDKDNGLLSAYFSKVEDDPMSQENSLTTPVPAQSNFENMDPKISNLGSENEAIEIKIKKIKSDIRDLKNRLNLQ